MKIAVLAGILFLPFAIGAQEPITEEPSPRQVEVVNLPTDDTGALRVSSTGCDRPETLVVEMIDQYRLGHDEEFVTEQIDLLDFYSGEATVQLVVHEEPNSNVTISANARWSIAEDQAVGFDDPDRVSVKLNAASPINSGSDVVINRIKGRFLKIRVRVHGNGATVSVHVMAIR